MALTKKNVIVEHHMITYVTYDVLVAIISQVEKSAIKLALQLLIINLSRVWLRRLFLVLPRL